MYKTSGTSLKYMDFILESLTTLVLSPMALTENYSNSPASKKSNQKFNWSGALFARGVHPFVLFHSSLFGS
jgi:hypothetical protein